MHARLSSDLKSVFMILQTHAEVNIRHQSTAWCWNTETVIVGQQCSKTTFFGDLVQVHITLSLDTLTGWLNWLNVCLYSVLFIAIYLYIFYPFIDALIGEALLNFAVYSMHNDNKGFLFYSILFYSILYSTKKHGCPHLSNNKHCWSVLRWYQYCSFFYHFLLEQLWCTLRNRGGLRRLPCQKLGRGRQFFWSILRKLGSRLWSHFRFNHTWSTWPASHGIYRKLNVMRL